MKYIMRESVNHSSVCVYIFMCVCRIYIVSCVSVHTLAIIFTRIIRKYVVTWTWLYANGVYYINNINIINDKMFTIFILHSIH